MNLNDALRAFAEKAGVDADSLIAYAAEDTHGGRNHGFNAMSIDVVEGQFLYAIVRGLQPRAIVEVGVAGGASATHMLAALEKNDTGTLVSFDIDAAAGELIPEALRKRWQFIPRDATDGDWKHGEVDVFFDDAAHDYESEARTLALAKALNPRIVISHDYFSHRAYGDGFAVQKAFEDAFPDNRLEVLFDGTERGFGVWLNPDWQPPQAVAKAEAPTPAPAKQATKRRPAKRGAKRG